MRPATTATRAKQHGAAKAERIFNAYRAEYPDIFEGGAGMEARLMADRLASAWVAFAKTGNPNNPALPAWR